MNNRSKRVMKDLEALGCYRDYDAISGAPVNYRHPNDPEQLFKVSDAMTDSARTFLLKRAQKVAGLSSTTGAKPLTIKERAEIVRRKNKTQRQLDDEARERRAAEAEREYEKKNGWKRKVVAEFDQLREELPQLVEARDLMAATVRKHLAGSPLHNSLANRLRDLDGDIKYTRERIAELERNPAVASRRLEASR